MEPRIPQNVKPEHTKKLEDPHELRLLEQIIVEAKAFCRADMRERQDSEK
jgi:hypothetical protein